MVVTESETEVSIDNQLTAKGWVLDPRNPDRNVYKQQARTAEQNAKLGRMRPDYVLYADKHSDKPTIVIEAKRPGESLQAGLQKAVEIYAQRIDAPIIIASDGYFFKTWHRTFKEPLFLDNREVNDFFNSDTALLFVKSSNISIFSKTVPLKHTELIEKFKKANDILKREGLSAGVERFSEFANLMFLKLLFENQNHDKWQDIEKKSGEGLLKAVQSEFKELKKIYPNLIDKTKIQSPKNMERLVEILSSFQLSHVASDIKGAAFEHFIHSYTKGTKNDLGQYFTPRHIIKMIVHLLAPKIGEKIYDPFCGTGGMLIECFRYINSFLSSDSDKITLKKDTLFGRDNADVARIATMNMVMFGDGHTNITRGDSYAALGKTKNTYDITITNIPFSQQTDFYDHYPIKPKNLKQNGDSIGVQHCLESLKNNENSRAAIIVPIGFLHKPELMNERLYIARNWEISCIVELSPKCFNPYTEQQTAVLILKKRKHKLSSDIKYIEVKYHKVQNDGFSQDGYRVPQIGENDIDKVIDGKDYRMVKISLASDGSKFKTINFFCRANEYPLKELAYVKKGNNITPKTNIRYVINGEHPIMMTADLAKNHVNYHLTDSNFKINNKALEEVKPYLFSEKTILIPTSGKSTLLNRRSLLGIKSYVTNTVTGIEANVERIHPYCLFYFFLNFDAELITYDLGYPGISTNILEMVPIPQYSEQRQKEIIAQIESLVKLHKTLQEDHKKVTHIL